MMRPVSSATEINSEGRISTTLGMMPTHERLEAADAPALKRHYRLVVDLKLLSLHGAPQVRFDLQQSQRTRVHLRIEHLILRFTESLGAVHRRIRVAQKIFRLLVAVAGVLDAHACGDKQLAAGEMRKARSSTSCTRSATRCASP